MTTIYLQYGNPRGPENGGSGPLARIVGVVVSVVALTGAAFLGLFVFLAILGMALIGGGVLAIRIWLMKRRIERAMRKDDGRTARDPSQEDYIDAEFIDRDEHRKD